MKAMFSELRRCWPILTYNVVFRWLHVRSRSCILEHDAVLHVYESRRKQLFVYAARAASRTTKGHTVFASLAYTNFISTLPLWLHSDLVKKFQLRI